MSNSDDKVERLAQDIKGKLSRAREWDKKKTNIPGIYLARLPGKDFRVILQFFPSDENGTPILRKGLFFKSSEALKAARSSFTDEGLDALVTAVEKINEAANRGGKGDDDDVLDVR